MVDKLFISFNVPENYSISLNNKANNFASKQAIAHYFIPISTIHKEKWLYIY